MLRMRGLLGPTAGAMLGLAAAPASAGDGYGEERHAAPAWRGFYVGAAAGYAIGTSDATFLGGDAGPLTHSGVQGVLTVGYDFRLSPRWVAGLFADYAFGEVDGPQLGIAATIDNQWAIGGRLGVLATSTTLLYVSGGYTAADFKGSLDAALVLVDTKLEGFFVGLGVEQALTRNLSLQLDYRYADYADVQRILSGVTIATFENTMHAVRLGVNWKFAATAADPAGGNDGRSALPAPTWSGFYVGAAAAYGIGNTTLKFSGSSEGPFSLDGMQGVLTMGYDFQLSPRWVAGLFADYAFGEVDGGHPALPATIDNQWAVGGRLGVLATPSTLLYASGGYTAADFKQSSGPLVIVDTALDGFFVGLGVEQALTRNLSLKLDYRFADYEDAKLTFEDEVFTFDNTVHAVRLGVNWKLH